MGCTSKGIDGLSGRRSAMSLIDAGFQRAGLFWDGSIHPRGLPFACRRCVGMHFNGLMRYKDCSDIKTIYGFQKVAIMTRFYY
jgi:hypothetical protein